MFSPGFHSSIICILAVYKIFLRASSSFYYQKSLKETEQMDEYEHKNMSMLDEQPSFLEYYGFVVLSSRKHLKLRTLLVAAAGRGVLPPSSG